MNRPFRPGFTLIELLTTIAILAILAGLIIPAVQGSRMAAQKLRCGVNLKQIGNALHSYHAAFHSFPIKYFSARTSAAVALLPFLDQSPLYDSINFAVGELSSPSFPGFDPHPAVITASSTRVEVFLCPSDGRAFLAPAGNSYRSNIGVGPAEAWTLETFDSANGFFAYPGCTTESSFPDGLSQTAAYSERLVGSGAMTGGDAERDYYNLARYAYYGQFAMRNADFALQGCRLASRLSGPAFDFRQTGLYWFRAGLHFTHYNHAQEPNGVIPDGLNTLAAPWGVSTARSLHYGGVNVLMGDGSDRFVSETISQAIWRAIGTRNGNEIVE